MQCTNWFLSAAFAYIAVYLLALTAVSPIYSAEYLQVLSAAFAFKAVYLLVLTAVSHIYSAEYLLVFKCCFRQYRSALSAFNCCFTYI